MADKNLVKYIINKSMTLDSLNLQQMEIIIQIFVLDLVKVSLFFLERTKLFKGTLMQI